jgi:hypothetical protein
LACGHIIDAHVIQQEPSFYLALILHRSHSWSINLLP